MQILKSLIGKVVTLNPGDTRWVNAKIVTVDESGALFEVVRNYHPDATNLKPGDNLYVAHSLINFRLMETNQQPTQQ